jgi:hypothetical protein
LGTLLPLVRSLLLAEAVTRDALAEALLLSAARGTPLVRALLMARAIDAPRLEHHLDRGHAPYMRHVAPVLALVERLPRGLCEDLLALPVRCDPRTGTVDVAVVDASDPHPVEEIAHWLNAPVRMVRTSLASLDEALQRTSVASSQGMQALAPPIWQAPSSPPLAGEREDDKESDPLDPITDPNIPFALTRKSLAPISQPTTAILDKIRKEDQRDAIFELVLACAQTVAGRVAVLAVRRGALVGWACSPQLADPTALRGLSLAPEGTALSQALDRDGAVLTRLPPDGLHAPLRSLWGTPPASEVAIVALRVERKPVALVIAGELKEPTIAKRRLEEIAEVAGAALAQALRHRRK